MATLLEFVSGLIDGFGLLAVALSVGGLLYLLVVLRPAKAAPDAIRLVGDTSLKVVVAAAGLLAVFRAAQLALKPWALASATGEWDIGAFMETDVFEHGASSVMLALVMMGTALGLLHRIESRPRWAMALIAAALFMGNEAWMSHAASRLDGGGRLMAVTVVHMLGGAVWAGGVAHLLLAWSLRRRHADGSSLWPRLVSRFSPLGITCAVVIAGPGIYLAWAYIGDWRGLMGTGYGNLLGVKIGLFLLVLLLATLNFFAAARWRRNGDEEKLRQRVPPYLEVEVILASAVLFTAAALTSLPPAVDVTEATASPREIWTMFSPKLPRLSGPETVVIEAPELTDLKTGVVGYKHDVRWDRFNHNVSGLIVLAIAALALLDRTGRVPGARHWPLLFIAFSLLLVLFANPDEWPLGPLGFLESAQNTEVIQHWLAAVVVFGLGLFEWHARREVVADRRLPFVFPVLCIVGGLVLLTHSHEIFELKREFLIQSTHVAMGVLGIVVGCSRWLELRLPAPHDRVAGYGAIAGIVLVGFILLFYVTPA